MRDGARESEHTRSRLLCRRQAAISVVSAECHLMSTDWLTDGERGISGQLETWACMRAEVLG